VIFIFYHVKTTLKEIEQLDANLSTSERFSTITRMPTRKPQQEAEEDPG
jgi:hypothetical protein